MICCLRSDNRIASEETTYKHFTTTFLPIILEIFHSVMRNKTASTRSNRQAVHE